MTPTRWTRGAACLCAMLLSACAGPALTPVAPATTAMAAAAAPGIDGEQAALMQFQNDQRIRARKARLAGNPVEAQQAWAAVLALAPADAEALEGHVQARAAALSAARDSARRAELAAGRGEVETAMRWHLEALANDPGLTSSVQALRNLERDRALRNAAPMAFARPPAPTAARSNPNAAELGNAEMLLAEGDLDGALALLEPAARTPLADNALKQRTCELLLRQAEARALRQRAEARSLVQRCLRLVPNHAAAQRQLRALREPGP